MFSTRSKLELGKDGYRSTRKRATPTSRQRSLGARRVIVSPAYGRGTTGWGPSAPLGSGRGFNNSPSELKVLDIASAAYACDTTGAVTLLNGITQGNDINTRVGRQFTNVSMQIKGFIAPQATTVTSQLVRVLLVWDMSPNSPAAVPILTDIFNASTSISPTNLSNRARFIIVRDTSFCVGGMLPTATLVYTQTPLIHVIDWYVRLGKYKTTNSGTTNAIGNIATGGLYLVTIGSVAAGVGSNFTAFTRLRFLDN